ncbi:MAG: hypothetical protein GXO88_02750 [Chlorobi bacterium]|nr:hypothetical protein [Chlorobiota bacterium]
MSINLNNYEVYLIDYLDGNLSLEVERELMLFLESNPGIKNELEDIENFKLLDEEKLTFNDKNSLKQKEVIPAKSINEGNYEEFFIAFYEKDLSVDEQRELDDFVIKNPQLEKEFLLHKSLILNADRIEFEHKNNLKKRAHIGIWQYQALAVAASIALLISFFWLLRPGNSNYHKNSGISFAQSRNISVSIKINTDIRLRKSVAKAVIETVKPTWHRIAGGTEFGKPVRIQALRMRVPDLALVGVIDCAKVRYPKNTGDDFRDLTGQENKSLLAKVISNNTAKLVNNIKISGKKDQTGKKDPALIKILQGGISFFATVTGSEVEQLKVYNSDGSLENYQLETGTFAINKNFKPKGAE